MPPLMCNMLHASSAAPATALPQPYGIAACFSTRAEHRLGRPVVADSCMGHEHCILWHNADCRLAMARCLAAAPLVCHCKNCIAASGPRGGQACKRRSPYYARRGSFDAGAGLRLLQALLTSLASLCVAVLQLPPLSSGHFVSGLPCTWASAPSCMPLAAACTHR